MTEAIDERWTLLRLVIGGPPLVDYRAMKSVIRFTLLFVVTVPAATAALHQPTGPRATLRVSNTEQGVFTAVLREGASRWLDTTDKGTKSLHSGASIAGNGLRDQAGTSRAATAPGGDVPTGVAQAPAVLPSAWPDPAMGLKVVRLWPEGVPGAIAGGGPELLVEGRVSHVHDPTLTVFPASPDKNTGTAVIVCPGGGYTRLAMDHEGRATAEWLNTLGVSAFVLRYRLKEYGHPAPLRDVLRAVRLLRADAKSWNIAADRIGVLGFSAGGHLAASAGTLFDDPDGRTGAVLDTTSARPDFMVLVYPVIAMAGAHAHSGSAQALLGAGATTETRARLSLESRVTTQTPPTFLVHGGTDTAVPPENSVLFYAALRRAGVPAELHVFQDGAHGVGLLPGKGPISDWPARCAEWLAHRGLLTPPAGRAPGQSARGPAAF
jgi:acetyl esterase/lipase